MAHNPQDVNMNTSGMLTSGTNQTQNVGMSTSLQQQQATSNNLNFVPNTMDNANPMTTPPANNLLTIPNTLTQSQSTLGFTTTGFPSSRFASMTQMPTTQSGVQYYSIPTSIMQGMQWGSMSMQQPSTLSTNPDDWKVCVTSLVLCCELEILFVIFG